jgi:hypothetical protein
VPEQPLRWGANVLFRHPPPVPSAERAEPGAARDGLGERRSPRAARSPFLSPWEERKGTRGEGESRRPCSAAPALKPVSPVSIGKSHQQPKFLSRSRTPRAGLTLVLHVGYNSYPDN